MSTSGITSLVSGYAQRVTGATPAANTIAGYAQEASESPETTVKEAQAGDPVAQKKLRQEQQMARLQQAARSGASEPGKGATIDQPA